MKPSSTVLQPSKSEGKSALKKRSAVTSVSHVCYQLSKNEQGGTEDAFCLLSIFKKKQNKTKDSFSIDRMPQCLHIKFLNSYKGHIKNRSSEAVT